MTRPNVTVVGAGVIGLCVAHECAERGLTVTLFDAPPPERRNCSLGNAGMIVPSHFVPLAAPGMIGLGLRMALRPGSPFSLRLPPTLPFLRWMLLFARSATRRHAEDAGPLLRDLHLMSRARFLELERRIRGGIGLETRGLVMVCEAETTLRHESELARRAVELGMDAEVVPGPDLPRLDPALSPALAGGVYFPGDAHLEPERLARGLEGSLGERVRPARVSGWQVAGRRIRALRSAEGEHEVDQVVVAAGCETAALLRPLGLRLPLTPGKGYSQTLPRTPEGPRLPAILVEGRVAITPMGEGLRIGGTMELGEWGRGVDRRRMSGIREATGRAYPGLPRPLPEAPVWTGLRPCSPDGLPLIGRHRRWENLWIATGHAMMGVSLAPVTGDLIAGMLCGETPPIDVSPLRPDRWG